MLLRNGILVALSGTMQPLPAVRNHRLQPTLTEALPATYPPFIGRVKARAVHPPHMNLGADELELPQRPR
jgi:hypothetical protein